MQNQYSHMASWLASDEKISLTEEQHAQLRDHELSREVREMYEELRAKEEQARRQLTWQTINHVTDEMDKRIKLDW